LAKRKYVQQSSARQVEIEMERPRHTTPHKGMKKPFTNENIVNFNSFVSKRKTVALIPKSIAQEEYIDLLENPEKLIVFATGPAGTGKTMLAVLAAIKALKEGVIQKIIITRPAVGVDDEKHGFLPGTLNEKMEPWTRPIFDVMKEYYSPREITMMLEEETIEISPLAFMRGRSFKNAWIIADEMQNATPSQMKMLLTRIGENCRLVVTGDIQQTDRQANSNGLIDFQVRSQNFRGHEYIFGVEFTRRDIQRHAAVGEILKIYGDE
jgi:phosphate starvation-inducible PhoH-like protein